MLKPVRGALLQHLENLDPHMLTAEAMLVVWKWSSTHSISSASRQSRARGMSLLSLAASGHGTVLNPNTPQQSIERLQR